MRIRVHYPEAFARITLRIEPEWDLDVVVDHVAAGGTVHEFHVEVTRPYFYFKPVLLRDGELRWACGPDQLVVRHLHHDREVWPYFEPDGSCSVCELRELTDPATGENYRFRVFTPPGYAENTLQRLPVLYLQDGQNAFFRGGAVPPTYDHDWRIEETLTRLAAMNAVDKLLAVGIYPAARERDYSLPGCEAYSRFLATVLKPHVDREFRTLTTPRSTAILGASLGGVASFHAGWQWPHVFGKAACLSSTFGWRDDLVDRVARAGKRRVVIYLDSGWPQDNYEVTRDMRALLVSRGWVEGRDLFYFAFPTAHHDEHSWAMRCHIPLQLFFGRPGPRS